MDGARRDDLPAGFFGVYARTVRAVAHVMGLGAGAGVLFMVGVICVDVVLRRLGHPLKGTLDLVGIAGAITISFALPYTTACKGHVAIEYFFQKLSRRGRIVVDTLARTLSISLFLFLTWECVRFGGALHRNGEATPTLQIPTFWLMYVVAASCAVVALVTLYHMLQPGKELIKP